MRKPFWVTDFVWDLCESSQFSFTAEDSDSDEEVEPLFIPKVGNSILWIKYTTADTIWMTVGEYDCGYVYEYDISKSDPLHCIELTRAIEMEVNSFLQM